MYIEDHVSRGCRNQWVLVDYRRCVGALQRPKLINNVPAFGSYNRSKLDSMVSLVADAEGVPYTKS
jgi:hypothetical protein